MSSRKPASSPRPRPARSAEAPSRRTGSAEAQPRTARPARDASPAAGRPSRAPKDGRAAQTPARSSPPSAAPQGLSDEELAQLQALLEAVPGPLESMSVGMLDGYLAGVLLQPRPVAFADWAPWVLDVDGRSVPKGWDTTPVFNLVRRRMTELKVAIASRQWFDPWVFEVEDVESPSEVVQDWVLGFATACEHFPELMDLEHEALNEPLALLFFHLGTEDLEDADDLIEEIESLEPPEEVDEAVEWLVRATLLLADISLPQAVAATTPRRSPPPRSRAPRRY